MLDALLGFVFEMVLNVVGTAIVKLFGVDNAAEVASVVIGLGILVLGVILVVWGH
ncbi:hypothetical protein [Bradyrhizobium sp. CCBAU 51627]|uniref:hypothetical protein n=1 Tax=Bradyrhizobium sp. CCBAU 51627 TaxID=1325088 RepID=UPI00230612E1|nr:hypothetical protein [Bradyrhizobium sp. CCBAU 51627]